MIELKNINKKYGDKSVFENFNINIEENKILCVLGESGSGKTTLMNILCELTEYSGEVVNLQKPLSVVFQKDRLIPNLTVLQNLRLVCKNAQECDLEGIGLKGVANAYPKSLSAGMARRVAILRALLYEAKTLLMDEPFINLDIALKFSLIERIKEEHEKTPKTIIMVTHDIKEAVALADRIILLENGKIIYDNDNVTENTENEIFSIMLKGNAKE